MLLHAVCQTHPTSPTAATGLQLRRIGAVPPSSAPPPAWPARTAPSRRCRRASPSGRRGGRRGGVGRARGGGGASAAARVRARHQLQVRRGRGDAAGARGGGRVTLGWGGTAPTAGTAAPLHGAEAVGVAYAAGVFVCKSLGNRSDPPIDFCNRSGSRPAARRKRRGLALITLLHAAGRADTGVAAGLRRYGAHGKGLSEFGHRASCRAPRPSRQGGGQRTSSATAAFAVCMPFIHRRQAARGVLRRPRASAGARCISGRFGRLPERARRRRRRRRRHRRRCRPRPRSRTLCSSAFLCVSCL